MSDLEKRMNGQNKYIKVIPRKAVKKQAKKGSNKKKK